MAADYRAWTDRITRLADRLAELAPIGRGVGVASPDGRPWFELLRQKLMVEIGDDPLLVVAVVGGTNIGKSVLFNHLGGETASAANPLAAGTRHPVCLAPTNQTDPARLSRLFERFELRPWHSPDDPLDESDANLLFWRTGRNVPDRLLLLDTPDVDSDVQVNWDRARAIRQAADVLIAVLTQQKYNDAAVKRFFREAVEADKPIVVVFNQCDLEADRPYWPQWLATFAGQIGAQPELVYVVPQDRRAAESLRLPFYRVGEDGASPPGEASDLRRELAQLEFDTIKIRTFRGALARVVDPKDGAPAYLRAIRAASREYASAAEALSASEMARVAWPSLPASILVDEIRDWWDADRADWSRKIHGFYRRLGQGVLWPIRAAGAALSPGAPDPRELMRRQERAAIVQAVKSLLDELDRLAQVGNDTLRPKLTAILGGTARADLLSRVEAAHDQLATVDEGYRVVLRGELDGWKEANPGAVRFLRSLDHVAAVARPAITVSLAVSGWIVAGDLVGQAAVQAVGHTAGNLATEAAIAGGITGGGEALVSTTTEGVRQAAGRLLGRLQERYAQQRAAWLAVWLEAELLGPLLTDLRRGAEACQSEPFRQVEDTLAALAQSASTPS